VPLSEREFKHYFFVRRGAAELKVDQFGVTREGVIATLRALVDN
jgi:hypothetical protein